jgi:hypothetical protein
MSPRKKTTSKVLGTEASGSGQQTEGEPKVIRATYDDTSGLLEKDGEMLKWGEVYHMFKKSNFSTEVEEPYELKVFKNIRKSGIFRVAAHPMVFPCVDSITWILKNIDVKDRFVCNARKDPIASFRPEYLASVITSKREVRSWIERSLVSLNTLPRICFPNGTGSTDSSNTDPKEDTPQVP